MDNSDLILKSLKILQSAYPRQKLTDDTIDVYLIALKDLAPDLLQASINRLISKSIFFPTVAEIRSTAADITIERQGKPTPIEAWGIAMQGGRERLERYPEVKEAVYISCGDFYSLRHSTMQAADRARFIEAYTGILERSRREVIELPAVREYIAIEAGHESPTIAKIRDLAERLKVE